MTTVFVKIQIYSDSSKDLNNQSQQKNIPYKKNRCFGISSILPQVYYYAGCQLEQQACHVVFFDTVPILVCKPYVRRSRTFAIRH